MGAQPSGTVTFLFSDVEGSTRLWERHRDAMRSALGTHDETMRSVIEEHGGYVFSTAGDAFCAAFSRAADAIAAAVEAQRSLAAEEWGPTEIKVRMAIHTGEAEERGGDYFGPSLNRVARLMSAAHGGQVLVSAVTAELVSDRLPNRAALVDLGQHRLKDLDAPEHVFRVADAALPRVFPPLRTVGFSRSNLPTALTSFIGRVEDVEDLRRLVMANRLVTLTGVGGVGKTRLAVEVARGLLDDFPDGVWFVDLSDIRDQSLIAKQVLVAARIQEQADRSIESTLIERLQGRTALLLVDSCEHLVDGVAALAERLLHELPGIAVLATSREALAVPGEIVWTVTPLAVPTEDGEDAADNDAVRLFIERAQSFDREFSYSPMELPHCARICRALDGVPLAIELAAARCGVLSVRQIAERLNDRLTLLGKGSRSTQARQQTLRAAIDWSYDLLDPEEQAMLRRLAVFRGGFTLEAAEALWTGQGATDALDLVQQLVDKSLVAVTADDTGRRFRLLETIRAYAQDRLESSGEVDATIEGHRAFFVSWAERQARVLSTPDQLPALAALEADHDNLRAVLERTVASEDLEPALRLAAALSFFWWLHSHFGESGVWYDRLLAEREQVSARVRARLLIGAGEFSMGVSDHSQAAARFEEARRLAREAGSSRIEGWALAYAMTNEGYREAFDASRRLGEEALEVFGRAGDALGVGYVTFMQATLDLAEEWTSGARTVEEARTTLTELEPMLATAQTVGERNLLGHVFELLGTAALLADRAEQATRYLAEAVRAFDTLGNQSCLAHSVERVALLSDRAGRPAEALRLLGGADGLRERIGIAARPAEQRVRDLVLDPVRTRLGDAETQAVLDEAAPLDREAVVQLALATAGAADHSGEGAS